MTAAVPIWPLQGRRVLVWGACGFVGRHLVPRLLADGAAVAVLTRPIPDSMQPVWRDAVSWFVNEQEGLEYEVIAAAARSADIVYNLAWSSGAVQSNADPLASLESTCRAQLMFLEACRKNPCSPHIVFVSTRLVYAAHGTTAITEESPIEPRSVYAAHKLCAEHYHRIFSQLTTLTFTILRTSPIFGYDEVHGASDEGIINTFIRRSVNGEPITIFGDGTQLRDFIYVDDFIDALIAASIVPGARNSILNVGHGERIRLRDAAETVRSLTGGPLVRYEPWPAEYARVEVGDYVVDLSKSRDVLGVSPRHSFDDGVALTIESFGSRGRHPGPAPRDDSAAAPVLRHGMFLT